MALAVTSAGGLQYLLADAAHAHIAGSASLDVVLASGGLIPRPSAVRTALVLVLADAFAKARSSPLPLAAARWPRRLGRACTRRRWSKTGVFLLARLYPALAGTGSWFWIVSLTGLAALLAGAALAIFQHDLKGLSRARRSSHLG